jgi:hypothetical protein
MKFCMQCGHELGASRTCSSCGTTAPVEPLPAPQLPPAGVRYPLFADEVDSVSVNTSGRVLIAPIDQPVAWTVPPPPPPFRAEEADATEVRLPAVPVVATHRSGFGTVWLGLAALVLGVFVLGGWLLLHDGPSSQASADGRGPAGAAASKGATGEATDVAATATAKAPRTRAPGQDTAGHQTSYDASNMLDGDPKTAWEMPGDGSGKVLTFTLARQTHLSRVGLINGYAKTGEQGHAKVDWYAGNRRVLQVEWLFDDGTTVAQDLDETTDLQTTDVDVTTKTVRLHLVEVSRPGTGKAARNMTPVSEVSLTGTRG